VRSGRNASPHGNGKLVAIVSVAGAGDAVVVEAPEAEVLLGIGPEAVAEAAPDPDPAHPVMAATIINVAKARVFMSPAYPLTSGPCQ
jgi:hypothetical protein